MTTFGIEEEYFLVDPATLLPINLAQAVLADLPADSTGHPAITQEFLASELERATVVCTELDQAEADLAGCRAEIVAAARRHGALATGTGTPFDAGVPTVTDTTRYRRLEADRGAPAPGMDPELLDAALWHASRDGIRGQLVSPLDRELAPAWSVTDALLRHVGDALDESGDRPLVLELLDRLWQSGTGAEIQHRAFQAGGLPGVRSLYERTFA
jgi:gamma-glutamyl:cysteine ligase YbdK (ATP-grasp superfamily)